MGLERSYFERVADIYGLGGVEEVREMEEGIINDVYDLSTEGGRFMVRILPEKGEDPNKGNDRYEFRVLNKLQEEGFRYAIPAPIENQEGRYISTLEGRHLWIYERIEGEIVESANIRQIREMGKALARYHNAVEGLELQRKGDLFGFNWIQDRYDEIRRGEVENEVDRFVMDNIDYMESVMDRIGNPEFRENVLAAHSDFHTENLLFEDDDIVGVLDFDFVRMRPRVKDLGYTAQRLYYGGELDFDDGRLQALVESYESINPLNESEKDMLFPSMAARLGTMFWWNYAEFGGDDSRRLQMLKEVVREMKEVEERL